MFLCFYNYDTYISLNSSPFRFQTEKLLLEMFQGHAAQFLAVLESLVDPRRRPLEQVVPAATAGLDLETTTDIYQVEHRHMHAHIGSPHKHTHRCKYRLCICVCIRVCSCCVATQKYLYVHMHVSIFSECVCMINVLIRMLMYVAWSNAN